jgi:hypothetical protein
LEVVERNHQLRIPPTQRQLRATNLHLVPSLLLVVEGAAPGQIRNQVALQLAAVVRIPLAQLPLHRFLQFKVMQVVLETPGHNMVIHQVAAVVPAVLEAME